MNSEGSSISDESTSGEFVSSSLEYECFKLNSESTLKTAAPIVIKSALKKSSSYFEGQKNTRMMRSGFFSSLSMAGDRSKMGIENQTLGTNSRQCVNYGKKNVTFSAYATIQVVDN